MTSVLSGLTAMTLPQTLLVMVVSNVVSAYDPSGNAIAEKRVQQIVVMGRCFLRQGGAGEDLWDEAYCFANDVINASPQRIPGREEECAPVRVELEEKRRE